MGDTIGIKSTKETKKLENDLLNAFYRSLQWKDGEIVGVKMLQLEKEVHKLLNKQS